MAFIASRYQAIGGERFTGISVRLTLCDYSIALEWKQEGRGGGQQGSRGEAGRNQETGRGEG